MTPQKSPLQRSAPWDALVRLVSRIEPRVRAQGPRDVWPLQGLAVRAASLAAAVAALVERRLWSEAFILGRTLMEIEITMKWLTAGPAASQRLSDYVATINDQQERLVRKWEDGASVSAQLFGDLYGDRLRKEIMSAKQASVATKSAANAPTLQPQDAAADTGTPDASIRERACATGLADSYDFLFWQMSCYAHADALSVIEFAPPEMDLAIRNLFSGNLSSGHVQRLVEDGLPVQILHTIGTANECLGLGLTDDIEQAWDVVHQAIGRNSRLEVEFRSPEDQSRGIRFKSADGSHKDYMPKKQLPRVPRSKKRHR